MLEECTFLLGRSSLSTPSLSDHESESERNGGPRTNVKTVTSPEISSDLFQNNNLNMTLASVYRGFRHYDPDVKERLEEAFKQMQSCEKYMKTGGSTNKTVPGQGSSEGNNSINMPREREGFAASPILPGSVN